MALLAIWLRKFCRCLLEKKAILPLWMSGALGWCCLRWSLERFAHYFLPNADFCLSISRCTSMNIPPLNKSSSRIKWCLLLFTIKLLISSRIKRLRNYFIAWVRSISPVLFHAELCLLHRFCKSMLVVAPHGDRFSDIHISRAFIEEVEGPLVADNIPWCSQTDRRRFSVQHISF